MILQEWRGRLADLLSRMKIRPAEWSLNRAVVCQLFNMTEWPHIDLFAARENAQLPVYCSWMMDPQAWAIDALSISWRGMAAYAFPPNVLIPKVLIKLAEEPCRLLLN
jgi:hypothetical protein